MLAIINTVIEEVLFESNNLQSFRSLTFFLLQKLSKNYRHPPFPEEETDSQRFNVACSWS